VNAPPIVLSIAGSDSSGGAGIQADARTFAAFGIHGATAVTAVTAQGADGVRAWEPVSVALVREQIRAALDDLAPAAVKTGMLATAAVVRVVAEELAGVAVPVVCDPVLVSSSGRPLLEHDARETLVEELLPVVTLLTPNADEAEALTGRPVRTVEDAEAAATALLARGPRAVLVKGGHLAAGPGPDVLVDASGPRRFEGPRVETPHTHGTGCVLSAALAAGLALGDPLEEAVRRAKRFVTAALRDGFPLGGRPGPVRPPRREPPPGDAP
jgi:hydroxymethylpyrimidine/phosphomethylpyrimidine kinase